MSENKWMDLFYFILRRWSIPGGVICRCCGGSLLLFICQREEWRVMAGRLTGLLQHSGASEGLRAGQAALIITPLLRYHIHADCHSTYWKYFIQDHSTAPGWRSGRRIMVLSRMSMTWGIRRWWNGWRMWRGWAIDFVETVIYMISVGNWKNYGRQGLHFSRVQERKR